jgi:cyanophycinase
VIPIGGAEEKHDASEAVVLERFLERAGGKKARIVVIPTASEDPKDAGKRYVEVFGKLGAGPVDVLMVKQRADANADDAVKVIEGADGVFITGGDQARLVSLLVGTRTMESLRLRNAAGAVVAGTSAGASILGSHMMAGGSGLAGNSNEAAARKEMSMLVAGFGLLQDVIIDQHFSERGRLGRLMAAFAANPGLVAVGLDQDTGAEIGRDGKLETLGSGMVTIIDGRNTESDYFEREAGEVLTVINSSIYILGPGRYFDLDNRRPYPLSTPIDERAINSASEANS